MKMGRLLKKISLSILGLFILTSCGTDPSKSIQSTEKMDDIPFERVTLDDTPEDVKATIEYKNREKATYVLPNDDDYYIVVSRGEQPTSGYEVEILFVEDWGDSIHVMYKFKDPADDELVSQATTFPFDIVRIKRTNKQILFKIVEHENERDRGLDINL